MDLAYLGADGEWIANGNYTANIIQRHVNQSVASLYAKNPRSRAKRRERLEFRVWDGKMSTLAAAQQMLEMAGQVQPTIDEFGKQVVDPMPQNAQDRKRVGEGKSV